jgi:hypothetical protein
MNLRVCTMRPKPTTRGILRDRKEPPRPCGRQTKGIRVTRQSDEEEEQQCNEDWRKCHCVGNARITTLGKACTALRPPCWGGDDGDSEARRSLHDTSLPAEHVDGNTQKQLPLDTPPKQRDCDRTTSKMRGLSPKIISGDSR